MNIASLGDSPKNRGWTGRTFATICESECPIAKIPDHGSFALAIITGIEGASYRPIGAMMVIDQFGQHWGQISSGCLEQDLILRAQSAMARGQPVSLRYGRGSPFVDIQLPCGGGLDIAILPNPDRGLLAEVVMRLSRRESVQISLSDLGAGQISGASRPDLLILPQVRFLVLGKGPEAACFARLADQSGFPAELYSTDPTTLSAAGFGRVLGSGWPEGVTADARSAVTLFYHDHDREPDLLEQALRSSAFYIGAQGSLRAHHARCAELARRGIAQGQIERIVSPFGLIPSARDPRTLAVSVLADILSRAQRQMAA